MAADHDAARDSGVAGTTAASGRSNGGAETGVTPGDVSGSPAATPKVGDTRNAAQGLRIVPTEAEIVSLREEIERMREALMRCGSLAVSGRADGCVPAKAALSIRRIAYAICWPDDDQEPG